MMVLAILLTWCWLLTDATFIGDGVPDAYQDSTLRVYRSYSDVTILHYHVPDHLIRATWQFAAFMDNTQCHAKNVSIHLRYGSYPLTNPANASWPKDTFVQLEQQKNLTLTTKYIHHDATALQVINPTSGSWFVAAYLNDKNQRIQQQGLGHTCRYTLSSVASWTSVQEMTLLTPQVPVYTVSSSRFTYFKVFVPEIAMSLTLQITNCTIQRLQTTITRKNHNSIRYWTPSDSTLDKKKRRVYRTANVTKSITIVNDTDDATTNDESSYTADCIWEFGISAGSLPLTEDIFLKEKVNFQRRIVTTKRDQYYYVTVVSPVEIGFSIEVRFKECVSDWEYYIPTPSYAAEEDVSVEDDYSPNLAESTFNSTAPNATSAALIELSAPSTANNTVILPLPTRAALTADVSLTAPPKYMMLLQLRDVLHPLTAEFRRLSKRDRTFWVSSNSSTIVPPTRPKELLDCVPVIPLFRIKHSQDFMDTFLLKSQYMYTSVLALSDITPVLLKFELLPFLDIGGTLQIGIYAMPSPANHTDQEVRVTACASPGEVPQFVRSGITSRSSLQKCPHSELEFNVSTTLNRNKAVRLVPFPQSGSWYLALQLRCYSAKFREEEPCSKMSLPLGLNLHLQPCPITSDGQVCGGNGYCEEKHRGQFFFSTCRCIAGWRGYSCSDGQKAIPHTYLLMRTLLLTMSNLFFVPAVVLALKRHLYTEAAVYLITMLFSAFYHACDEECFSFCLLRYELLQFCDFYSALLSFWVTLLSMAVLPWRVASCAHMLGALGIALGVRYQRTALAVFLVPVCAGMAILVTSWCYRCARSKSLYPSGNIWLCNLLPGTLFAACGLALFSEVETEDNYKYVHSGWHALIALSIIFLLPTREQLITPSNKGIQSLSASPMSVRAIEDGGQDGERKRRLLEEAPEEGATGSATTTNTELCDVSVDTQATISDSQRLLE